MKVVASAPGKVNLVGEYSNLFNRPAIVAAIDRRTIVEIESSVETLVSSSLVDPVSSQVARRAVEQAVARALDLNAVPPYAARIRSSVPVRRRLGSSAALAAAYCAALARYAGAVALAPDELNKMAYEVERTFHGRPAGTDNTISVFGGVLWVRRTSSGSLTHDSILLHDSVAQWSFCVVDSGTPAESTGEMVAQLHSALARDPKPVTDAVDSLDALAHTIRAALGRGDWGSYASATNEVQRCLGRLRAVGERAQALVDNLAHHGCAAKVMGGGGLAAGSGMLLVVAPDGRTMGEALKRTGLALEPIALGQRGCLVEGVT